MISNVNLEHQASDFIPARRLYVSNEIHSKITVDMLSERFMIGLPREIETIQATTKRGVRSEILPLERRYLDDRYFRQKRLMAKFSTNTLYPPVKSLNGHKDAQVYSHRSGFTATYDLHKAYCARIGRSLCDLFTNRVFPTISNLMVQWRRLVHILTL